jgi:transcriptional regulator with XRE-family HTH domain
MSEEKALFIKEIGRILQKYRKNAKLSQTEIAVEIGLSKTSGFKYISCLETGRINNPSLITVLRYLKACQTPWTKFFQKLSEIDFKIEHKKVMRQVEMPSSLIPALRKKIDRDTALYENKVQYPKTPFQRLDWERIRIKIDKKVKTLLFNHQLDEKAKMPYFTLTNELILNYDSGQIPAIIQKHWQARILNRAIIEAIRKIVYQTIKLEQKRLERQKALPSEKYKKMAGSFLRYRVKIEPIEAEVQKKLGELNVPIAQNQAYKDFVRECYKAFKKYYLKDPSLLTQKFSEITKTWKQMGLDEEVMEKVKEIAIRLYKELTSKIKQD